MKVRVRIESIAIEGLNLERHQESALRAALQRELADLFASGESFSPSHTRKLIARMTGPAATLPEPLGSEIARAIHQSVPRHAQ